MDATRDERNGKNSNSNLYRTRQLFHLLYTIYIIIDIYLMFD